ncbi:MAG: hypothetical protein HN712_18345 [Gemmatimonadetes bacterium]|jgi:hypothetical protein|nr:hypothetical protein [Gemmatimonadota bacterium]MBT7862285.1 hypothetical protein [Gemmatimonadota bacterium]
MLEYKQDAERVIERYEAWWSQQIIDRPLISFSYARPQTEQRPTPVSQHATHRERWLDTSFAVATAEARMANTVFGGDALPTVIPNLGPEVFSSFYGCELEFTETTSWCDPILSTFDMASIQALHLNEEGVYFRKILEITDALIEAGRDRFLVGYTDLHPGGDGAAGLRDPQQMCIDVLERPQVIRALCERLTDDFLRVFDRFHDHLLDAGMRSTTWLPAVGSGRMHVPSNDFSCMISASHFDEIFVPSLERECAHMDHCIYHLDGPQALQHLDRILSMESIQAMQWVPGAGQSHWAQWVDVYRRIQAAGRSLMIYPPVDELDQVFEVLRPEGVWLQVSGIQDEEMATQALAAVSKWR